MNIADIPARWLEILSAIQVVEPGAVLVGGALRDLAAGAPVKDLDIFFGINPLNNRQALDVVDALLIHDPDASLTMSCNFSSCDELGDCYQTDTYRLSDGTEVNLIVLAQGGLKHVVERVDFGICQIGTDGVEVYETEQRIADLFAKTFTIVRGDTEADIERSLRRWDRLSQKYPGWTLVNPHQIDR